MKKWIIIPIILILPLCSSCGLYRQHVARQQFEAAVSRIRYERLMNELERDIRDLEELNEILDETSRAVDILSDDSLSVEERERRYMQRMDEINMRLSRPGMSERSRKAAGEADAVLRGRERELFGE